MEQSHPPGIDSPRAWVTAATAFTACFTLFGVAYTFGAFFKPMGAEFGATRVPTSAVFSITAAIYNLLGAPAGHLSDRWGPRPVVMAGALFMGVGLVLTSFIDRLWLGYLTYGIGVGVGVACCYVPMLAMVSGWFARRRNTALGIAVAGVGCGALVAPAAAALIERYGWRHTYVVLGVASALLLSACALLSVRPPVHVHARRARLGDALRSPSFAMLYVSSILSSIAIYVPYVYLPEFAHDHGASPVAAATLVAVIGGASVAGRLGLGTIADRTGIIALYKACTLALGLSYAVWVVTGAYAWLVIFALVMGAAYGGVVALAPAVVAELFGVQGMGAVLGTLYTSSSISALVGPPLAGLVIDRSGSYVWAAVFAGLSSVVGYLVIVPLRHAEPALAPRPAAAD